MTDNLYAPPRAAAGNDALQGDARTFYVVSPRKLTILFWGTFGNYALYLFYKNWALQKQATGADIMPVMRGLFSIFFVLDLYQLADERLTEKGETHPWDIHSLATKYIVLVIGKNVLERITISQPFPQLLALGMLYGVYRTLARAQNGLNLAAGDAEGTSNRKLTAANYVWILLGVALWVIVILGLLSMVWPGLLK